MGAAVIPLTSTPWLLFAVPLASTWAVLIPLIVGGAADEVGVVIVDEPGHLLGHRLELDEGFDRQLVLEELADGDGGAAACALRRVFDAAGALGSTASLAGSLRLAASAAVCVDSANRVTSGAVAPEALRRSRY